MKVYKSKVDTGILLFLILVIGGTSIPMIYSKIWIGLAINASVALFIWHLFSTTCYTIKDKSLEIKSSFFYEKTLPIDTIKKVSESNNPLSSPANSLDRLEIIYGEKSSILISPKDKVGFTENLKAINPKIEIIVKERNRKCKPDAKRNRFKPGCRQGF